MKIKWLTVCLMVSILSCKSKPETAVTQTPAMEAAPVNVEPALAIGAAEIEPKVDPAPQDQKKNIVIKKSVKENTQASTVNKPSGANSVIDNEPKDNGTGNATASGGTSGNAAEVPATETTEKKKWSGTAKGAVIGGATGAAAGAVINKKNRAIGAVVGGVIGAGTGAVIGKQVEKKEGGN